MDNMNHMKEYNYSDIREIDNKKIVMKDNYEIIFEECRREWAKANKIDLNDSVCVAERVNVGKLSYFIFYTKERVKIHCKTSYFCSQRRMGKICNDLRILLNKYGYSSYDMT